MKNVKLKDITLNITDGKHGDCEGEDNSGYYFISCKDVHGGAIHYNGARQITEKDYIETNKRTMLEPNDILVTNSGTIGRMALVKDSPETYKTTFQKSVAIVKPNQELVRPAYLYYCLLNCVNQFVNQSNGSAQKNLLLGTMREFVIPIEDDFKLQDKVTTILSSYDSLIENNQKQIKLLEEAAQRLYKEWFVDLRFPGYETTPVVDGVPEGWALVPLSECISYEIGGGWGEEIPTGKCDKEGFVIRGTDFYGITHGDYNVPFRYHSASNLNSRVLSDGDIIFEVSGGSKTEGVARTAYITQKMIDRWQKPVMCASFCKLIRSKDDSSSLYLFNHLQYLRACGKTTEYDKKSASSIVNYRWKDFLSQEYVLIPHSDVLTAYNSLAKPLQDSIVNCSLEIEKASIVRDRILPKLMSGELEM